MAPATINTPTTPLMSLLIKMGDPTEGRWVGQVDSTQRSRSQRFSETRTRPYRDQLPEAVGHRRNRSGSMRLDLLRLSQGSPQQGGRRRSSDKPTLDRGRACWYRAA